MKFRVPEQMVTQRLILRQFRDEDWHDLHHYYSSAHATQFTVGRPLSEGETWRALSSMVGHWHIRRYGPYAVEEKLTGSVLGVVGFWYPNDWPSPEIKWALAPKYWGQGYASEAVRAVQQTGLCYLSDIALISFIHGENLASRQLARAVGAVFEKEVPFRGGRWSIYRHPQRSESAK